MAAAAAQLLGEDGRGYELARRLEACGAWRAWLGDDAAHAALTQHLTSPATWDNFLSPAASPSPPPRPLLLLQLRVRALLFDKASAALQLAPRAAGPAGLHSINANCECHSSHALFAARTIGLMGFGDLLLQSLGLDGFCASISWEKKLCRCNVLLCYRFQWCHPGMAGYLFSGVK
jgi:hypothetical protein